MADQKKTNWRQEEWRQRALKSGGPSLLQQLPFLKTGKDPWVVEHQKRQQEVKDQYWQDKKGMIRQRRLGDRKLRDQLRREKDDVDRYYRLHELHRGDRRLKTARNKARRKFQLSERKITRKHRDDWQKQLRKLRINRDIQLRKVTKVMKLESRKARDLPSGPGGFM